MRKLYFLTTILILVISSPSFINEARADVASGSVKIGYVDFNRVLNGVEEGRAARTRLQDEFKEKQQRLDKMQKELSELKNKIDKDRLVLSSDVLKNKEEEYRNKFFELQQMLVAFRGEMETRESNLTMQILKRLRSIVNEIGSQEGYQLILEKSQDVVLYAPQGDDITDRVIDVYNGGKGRNRR